MCIVCYHRCLQGDLIDQLNDRPKCRFTESMARKHLSGLVAGLMYMKQKRICHRDLSPENIMIGADGTCKVIDLGMCLCIPEAKINGQVPLIRRQLMRGKLSCMAPEIHRELPFDGFAVDVWALGAVLFVMTVGKRLYSNPMDEVRIHLLVRTQLPLRSTHCRKNCSVCTHS